MDLSLKIKEGLGELRFGMPVEEVQLYLGHESIQTTMGYAEVNKDNIKSNFNKTIL